MTNAGGRAAIGGFLYQILCSLGRVTTIAMQELDHGAGETSAQLVLEPEAGDLQISEDATRVVEQFKSRSTGKPWTSGEIINAVLPDLLKATRNAPANTRLVLRFVTNGRCVADDLQRFTSLVSRMADPNAANLAIGSATLTFHMDHEECTAAEYLSEIARRLGCQGADDPNLLRLLANFEIEDESDEAKVVAQVDAVLSKLVEAREDVESKRNELIGRLLELARGGASIDVCKFLRDAGLDPVRLRIVQRLPAILGGWLRHSATVLGYERRLDVRPPLVLSAGAPVVVIEGDSGQGKSWSLARLADDLAERGQLVILLPAEDRLTDIEKFVVQRIWHSASFDHPMPLSNIAERIAPSIPSEDRYWLTLCIDDVQNGQLIRDVAHENWSRFGVRIVMSTPPRMANMAATMIAGTQRSRVRDFTIRELRDYLGRRGREPTTIPDDVIRLLQRPILALLYCRIADGAWVPQTEYALIDRYWRYATSEYAAQTEHPGDKHHLKLLASSILDPSAVYPWPDAVAIGAGLSDERRKRLLAAGLLQATDNGVALSHDRLLNWAVAEWLRDQLQQRTLTVQAVGEFLQRILRIDGDWVNNVASRRLGYVPMDLLWLLVVADDHNTAAALIAALSAHSRLRITEKGLFRELLPTLGSKVLTTLVTLLAQPLESDRQWLIAREVGEAIGVLGQIDSRGAANAAHRLLDLSNAAGETAALTALAKISAPSLLDRIWAIHLRRKAVFESKAGHHQGGDFLTIQESFAALVPSSRATPEWIARTARSPTPHKDQLVYLLMSLPHAQALTLWRPLRDLLFADVAQNRWCLARALRAFGTTADVAFLEAWIAEGGDGYDLAARFDALARLSPEGALACLPAMRQTFLASTTREWLPGLFLRAGPAASAAFLATFGSTFEGVRDLAMIYAQWQEYLDVATLRRILDVLTEQLAERDSNDKWEPRGAWHLLRLVAHLYRPELLAVLAEYRGHHLEELLVRRAARLSGRVGLDVDRDEEDFCRVLLKMGSAGLQMVVLGQLNRQSKFARIDGLRAALWVDGPALRERLRQMANDAAPNKDEAYALINVLTALGERDAIVALLRAGVNLPLSALSHAKNFSPLSDEDFTRARDDVATGNERARLAGILTLAISGRSDASDALIDLVGRAPTDSADARVGVMVLNALECYAPTLLPKLQAMLTNRDSWNVVADYLVNRSEAGAHAPLIAHFATHTLQQIRGSEIQVAFGLLRHADSVDETRQFLRRLSHSSLGSDIQGDLQTEFLKAGDEQARDILYELAWRVSSSRRGSAAAATRTLATFDQQSAYDAACRQLRHEFSFDFLKRLLKLDPEAGFDVVVNELYESASRKDRWLMGRAIRWYVDPTKSEPKLEAMSVDEDPRRRKAACEILGWQKDDMLARRLIELIDDNEKSVEGAALEALRCQRHQQIASELRRLLVSARRDRKWAFLTALVQAADPYLLNWEEDPLSIRSISDELPPGYEQTLEDLMRDAYKVADNVKDPEE